MSISQVPAVGPQAMPQQVQAPVQTGFGADVASSAAGSAAAAASTTSASQSTSISSTSAAQSISYTSANSQVTSYYGTPEQGTVQDQLVRLVVMMMLLDELLNGERGSDQKMAMLGMAIGLMGGGSGGQSTSVLSYSSSYESLSITQQSSVTNSTATAAYNNNAGGPPSAEFDPGSQIDINA